MLKYTGHPLLDVGIATIVAFAKKTSPEELNENDLDKIASYMEQNYTKQPLRSFLTVVFPNSGFTQPAFFKSPDKQNAYKERVLRAYQNKLSSGEQGVFLGIPANQNSFNVPNPKKDDLPAGRAFRQHIPLLTGEDVINFYPYGDMGLPISGEALLAFQAMPLGSAKCGGRVLLVHSDNPEIMQYFAKTFLEGNRSAIGLAQQEGSKKMPEPHLKHKTLLIDILIKARHQQIDAWELDEPFSITVYHLTNSGQGAGLSIYHLPSQVIIYLKDMARADYSKDWGQLVHRAWVQEKMKRGQKEPSPDYKPNKNWLYEDLFDLMQNVHAYAPRFIRIYFLRIALNYAKNDKTDPRGRYSTQKEVNLVSWKLTEPFLRRIMNMESERIDSIRKLGDALANYVKEENDKRFFRAFYIENRYGYLRNALIKANTAHAKRGHAPFLTLDNYLSVFEDGEDLARVDWRLARDLVLIRMIEQLYANGWLGAHEDAIPETIEETENETEK